MRLVKQKHQRESPDLNMAAMIDVVFLLLIFFLVTSAFEDREAQVTSAIPRPGNSAVASDFDPIRVQISFVDEKTVAWRIDGQSQPNIETLQQMLKVRSRIAEVPVLIKTIGNVPYEKIVEVTNACREAGLKPAFDLSEGN